MNFICQPSTAASFISCNNGRICKRSTSDWFCFKQEISEYSQYKLLIFLSMWELEFTLLVVDTPLVTAKSHNIHSSDANLLSTLAAWGHGGLDFAVTNHVTALGSICVLVHPYQLENYWQCAPMHLPISALSGYGDGCTLDSFGTVIWVLTFHYFTTKSRPWRPSFWSRQLCHRPSL